MSSAMTAVNSKINSRMAVSRDGKPRINRTHRRSRSGCFTCRLRRKKCEEGKPSCKACSNLGLVCDYKRPDWWANADSRINQKEAIKDKIQNTQKAKKKAKDATTPPPSLCHSRPTTETFSDSKPPSRTSSVCTPFEPECDFTQTPPYDYITMQPPDSVMSHHQDRADSPYQADVKIQSALIINDISSEGDSTIPTYSTFQSPPKSLDAPGFPGDCWVQQGHFDMHHESFSGEPVNVEFLDFPHEQMIFTHESIIEVDECDKPLLSHFIEKVSRLIFPILNANQHGSARSDVILPALASNKSYLHCCLSISALHKKSTENVSGEQIDQEILRHRFAAISELCAELNLDTNHAQILETTLGMIFFQCSVGRPTDSLPDIPWHQHFQAAADLVEKLELPDEVVAATQLGSVSHPPFNMALTAWIDILGATMLNRIPIFADTYRDVFIGQGSLGLSELTGCADQVMFLISEIACLEARKLEGIVSDDMLYSFITTLGENIGLTEHGVGPVQNAFSGTGAIRPEQLGINVTAAFRFAARIYLSSLLPAFDISSAPTLGLVRQFCEVMEYIPAGLEGHDRSLIWPLLIVGSVSIRGSPFRDMFQDRCSRLGEAANLGSFGRIRELLGDVWQIIDADMVTGSYQYVSWRDVMQQKGWDFLLI